MFEYVVFYASHGPNRHEIIFIHDRVFNSVLNFNGVKTVDTVTGDDLSLLSGLCKSSTENEKELP